MTPPQKTADGFEQFGTNPRPFALTGLLLEAVQRAEAGRIVTLNGLEHRGAATFTSTIFRRRATIPAARLPAVEARERGVWDRARPPAARPARARSACSRTRATRTPTSRPPVLRAYEGAAEGRQPPAAQNAERGALPTLYFGLHPRSRAASTSSPDSFNEMRGNPKRVKTIPEARDPAVGRRLSEVSEQLTGRDPQCRPRSRSDHPAFASRNTDAIRTGTGKRPRVAFPKFALTATSNSQEQPEPSHPIRPAKPHRQPSAAGDCCPRGAEARKRSGGAVSVAYSDRPTARKCTSVRPAGPYSCIRVIFPARTIKTR